MFHQEVEAGHSEEQKQRVRAAILREADVISHEGQRDRTGKSNSREEGSGKEIDHGYGEGSEDQRDDAEVPLRFCKRIKQMGQKIE